LTEKEQQAHKTIKKYMWGAVGAAALIPLPVLDFLAVSGVQLKMVAAISKIYDVPFEANCGKAVIGSLVGSLVPGAMSCGAALSVLKATPLINVFGGAAMALISGATTWALGKVFIQHFESGGTFLDFNPDEVKEYFTAQFKEGGKIAATMGTKQNAEAPV
jgi:uncharacterized protein (DUF697 family)